MVKEDKGFYDKKIVYLDYLERNNKVKNGGFLKWETKGETSRVQIHIRGLYPTDTMQAEIQIVSKSELYPADKITLKYGTGEYAVIWKNEGLAGTEISCDECDGIQIRLSENRVLKGIWRERKRDTETTEIAAEKENYVTGEIRKRIENPEISQEVPEMLKEMPKTSAEGPEELKGMQETSEELSAALEETPIVYEDAPKAVKELTETAKESDSRNITEDAEVIRETELEEEEAIRKAEPEAYRTGEGTMSYEYNAGRDWRKTSNTTQKSYAEKPVPLSGDKWEQLGRHYPRIHPFGDDREYLSITPRDFVILSRQYQNLVQNSFLLHGYYNYGHVILTKIKEQEEDSFYLGVPGVYFDREKQAALMFGFEGFEAGTDRVSEGGFGYYMKRVEI